MVQYDFVCNLANASQVSIFHYNISEVELINFISVSTVRELNWNQQYMDPQPSRSNEVKNILIPEEENFRFCFLGTGILFSIDFVRLYG